MITITLVVTLLTLIAYLLWKAHRINKHWAERGIKHFKPVLILGNNLPMVLGKKNSLDIVNDLYKAYPDELVIGYYNFLSPTLYVRDENLVQKILIKDFAHFTDRGLAGLIDFEKIPRQEQLFFMNGNRWRTVRNKISPIFTSGKLKDMFTTMTSVGKNLLDHLKEKENEEIDAKELMSLFATDVISSAVFGADPATLKNPKCEFRLKGKQITEINLNNILRALILIFAPKLMKALNISIQDQSLTNYFCDIIQKTFDYRRETGTHRNDFIQLMMQLKEKGTLEVQSWDSNDDYLISNEPGQHLQKIEITDDLLLAQAQSFMINGFETTSRMLAFAVYEITQHEDIQNRLYEEISEQIKIAGELTYDALKNMKLLDCVIKETLRLHPVIPALLRVCTKTYVLPNGYAVNVGDLILIPIDAIHKDPNYFTDPNEFKPERFLDTIKQGTYLPFGEGPRICIAMRYALMVIKYGLALFLINYRVKLSEKVKVPLEYGIKGFGVIPKGDILIKLSKTPSS